MPHLALSPSLRPLTLGPESRGVPFQVKAEEGGVNSTAEGWMQAWPSRVPSLSRSPFCPMLAPDSVQPLAFIAINPAALSKPGLAQRNRRARCT